jgi:hypothetical protein
MAKANQAPGKTDKAANTPRFVPPLALQDDFDNQGCPPIETFREPDLAPRPSASIPRPSSKANGKSGGKGSGGKGNVRYGGSGRTSRTKKPKKKSKKETMLKRFSSK